MENKGCILEIRENTMIIMTQDCGFKEIRRRNGVEVGMEIFFYPYEEVTPPSFFVKHFISVAAAIILLVITSVHGRVMWRENFQSVAVFTLDINPSIQLEMNEKKQVIKVMALNQEAKGLHLDKLKRKSIEEALHLGVQMAQEKGYISTGKENYVVVSAVFLKEDHQREREIENLLVQTKEFVEEKVAQEGSSVEVMIFKGRADMLQKAKEEEISLGKIVVYEKLKELGNREISLEKVKGSKVGEIVKDLHPPSDQHIKDEKDKKNKGIIEVEKEEEKNTSTKEKEHPIFQEHPSKSLKEVVSPKHQLPSLIKTLPPTNQKEKPRNLKEDTGHKNEKKIPPGLENNKKTNSSKNKP